MAKGSHSMTKVEEAIFQTMSTKQSIQEDTRALTLQLTALQGKFEQPIRNRNSNQAQISVTSAIDSNRIHHSKNLMFL